MTTTHADDAAAYFDDYDRVWGALDGIGLRTPPSTIDVTPPLGVGGTQTYVITTVRWDEGDTLFVKMIGRGGQSYRLAIPPVITAAIARQRESLTTRARKRGAKQAAATRKARGIEPAFLKKTKMAAVK